MRHILPINSNLFRPLRKVSIFLTFLKTFQVVNLSLLTEIELLFDNANLPDVLITLTF